MPNTKLLFFLAVWKRPEITEICFKGINRIRKYWNGPVECLAVVSEESMIPLCEKYGIDWVMHENLPLGRKKNFGLQKALEKDFDYLIEIGSDDLVKNELLDLYEVHFKKGIRMLGITSFAYIDSTTGECREFRRGTSSTFGLARAFRRDVIEQFTNLWPDDLNKGLDNASHFLLARHGILGKRIITEKPLAVDIKSDVNIWGFHTLGGKAISFKEATEGLSDEEIESIQWLAQKQSETLISA